MIRELVVPTETDGAFHQPWQPHPQIDFFLDI